MNKEQKFYSALQEIFVGAEVEGKSGYINLMRIKSKYYNQGVFPRLQKDIESALEPFPDFKEELFDKLYTFFKRYFSETGSIYFRYTPLHQNVYEKVYRDDRDIMLFWKTHMLYYVKKDRLFKNLEIKTDGFKFFFDVSNLEHKKAYEKKEIIYDLKGLEKEKIVFSVTYSERGRKTKIKEILKALNNEGIKITEDVLKRAFRVFEKQSEVDYFINKNAKEFLKEQFNIWLYQYVFSGESKWTEKRIRELQALKNIAFKIIDFISQFEDELVKIWNKPKFVLNSNYVITLDRIASKKMGIEIIKKLLKHPNFDEQIKEWKELKIIGKDFAKDKILENKLSEKGQSKGLSEDYQFLPIDTKYFKDLELEILSLFDDLDGSLDGWLIKSENYQALNTILPKFKDKIRTIYIDPPFNKEQEADYFYSVNYKDSSWATLLENRLNLTKELLNEKGSIFVRCDYNGNWIVRPLLDNIFGKDNFRNEIIVRRFKKNVTDKNIKKLPEAIDNIYVFSKNSDKFVYLNPFKKTDKKRKGFWRHMGDSSGQGTSKIFFGKELSPPKGKHWKFSQKRIDMMIEEEKLILKCKKCGYTHNKSNGVWRGCPECGADDPQPKYWVEEKEHVVLDSNWSDIQGYSTKWGFQTENSEVLLKRIIESTSKEGDMVLDFFLGSGTTTAVAHKLKRKWVGIEMGDHFDTVVLPRMKKVLYYDGSGISEEIQEVYNPQAAGGFFKYYELEQYEDTLSRVKYEDSEFFDNPYDDPYNQYIFMKDLKMLEALSIDYENNKVKVDLSKLYNNIDVPETISNVLGSQIKKINFEWVELDNGEKINIKDLDYKLIKPLIWW